MTATSWCKTPSGARSLLALLIASFFSLPAFAQTYPFPGVGTTASIGAAIGDFNGDGLPDQAYITVNNTFTVFLNEGPNNPSVPVVTSGLSCTPQQLTAADMNKDGKLDIVLTCAEAYVAVLFGNGDGTFQAASYYAIAAVPGANLVAPPVDLNGDGYPDIVVGNIQEATNPTLQVCNVVVLLNKGSAAPGVLTTATSYPSLTGSTIQSITVGDFDGDGKQDVIVGSPIVVFYGNGDGTLQTGKSTAITTNAFVTGDFSGDGLTDVAYFNSYLGTGTYVATSLQVLLGSSNRQFTTGPNLPLPTSMEYSSIVPFKNTNTSSTTNLALVGLDTLIVLGDSSGGFTPGQAYFISGNPVGTQVSTNGTTNLLYRLPTTAETILVPGNGDGTFQSIPDTILQPASSTLSPMSMITTDLNGDGLTDVLSITSAGNLVAALGRGNGRFSISSQITGTGQIVVSGDFNNDGKVDAITVSPGTYGPSGQPLTSGQLFFYGGNGDGTFQPALAAMNLQVSAVGTPVVGDFNGDNKLDLLIPYGCNCAEPPPSGDIFLAGKGDGTFAAPVSLPLPWTSIGIAADLRNDGKLDIVGGDTVDLGNGDGTFTAQPLGLSFPGSPLAIGDLNGDGKPDLVDGTGVYAGNGDGTFQSTPFAGGGSGTLASAYIGDVNGDGNNDLIEENYEDNQTLDVIFGDGAGGFTSNQGVYFKGYGGGLARENNQAPQNDHTLDFVSINGGSVTTFLNQNNPAPATPAPLPSKTVLTASASSAAPGQQLTLTATVTGVTPTGNVTFVSGTTSLGTAPVTNGTATLATSFATVGTFPITANYAGDANNTASSSSAVSVVVALATSTTTLSVSASSAGTNQQLTLTATVTGLNPSGKVTFATATSTLGTASLTNGVATLPFTFTTAGSYAVTASYAGDVANSSSTSTAFTVAIAVPDYTITASPTSASISPGQSATTTLTITPVGGYSGTVKFSCGTLPSGATCTFAPASVTPTSGAATSTLTITTTAPSTARLRDRSIPLQGIAWAGLILLTLSPRKLRGLNRRLARATLLTLLLAAGLLSFSGCSSSSPSNNTPTNPGTPAGAQTITLTAADSSGNLSHAINFQVTVQ